MKIPLESFDSKIVREMVGYTIFDNRVVLPWVYRLAGCHHTLL